MKYELNDDIDGQQLILHDFRFFGSYDESLFCNTLYSANFTCNIYTDYVTVNIPNSIMYWQAKNVGQLLQRYRVPSHIISQITGITRYDFSYKY